MDRDSHSICKLSSSNLKVFCLVSIFVLIVGLYHLTEVSAKSWPKNSFVSVIGRPLVFGGMDMPYSFFDNLKKLNSEGVLDIEENAADFWDHDVFVVFVKNWSALKADNRFSALKNDLLKINPKSYVNTYTLRLDSGRRFVIRFYRIGSRNVDGECLAKEFLLEMTRDMNLDDVLKVKHCFR